MKRGSVIIMKSREMYAADKIPRIAFYIVLAVIAAAFIIAEMVYPSERTQESQSKNLLYHGTFVWEKEDGSREKIDVPGEYDVPVCVLPDVCE